jgi:predicted DCC family thiol-disulfide oxidoreductase YuxK
MKKLNVYFDESCGICGKIARIITFLDFRDLIECSFAEDLANVPEDNVRERRYIDLFSFDGNEYISGYNTYLEITKRLPLMFLLHLVMKISLVRILGEKIYRKVADNRSCKIK